MQNNITGLLVVHNLLAEELNRIPLVVGVERLGQNLVRLAVPLNTRAFSDDAVPPHAHDLHAVGIQRTGGHAALPLLPVHVRMYAPIVLPLDACAVESKLSLLCLFAVQNGDAVFEKST